MGELDSCHEFVESNPCVLPQQNGLGKVGIGVVLFQQGHELLEHILMHFVPDFAS